jgi:hypothetical protein
MMISIQWVELPFAVLGAVLVILVFFGMFER